MRRRILLVDDDPYFCFSMELALKKSGYRVSRIADARNALECVTESLRRVPAPDLILLDLDLSGLLGSEIVRLACRRRNAIPVLAYSGYFDAPRYQELMRLGCRDILFKPVGERMLLDRVDTVWARG